MRALDTVLLAGVLLLTAGMLLVDLPAVAATTPVAEKPPAAAKPPAATIDAARGPAGPQAPGQPPPGSLADALTPVTAPALDFGPTLHVITPPHDEPFLPDGPGREAFVANCLTCHSPRYVTNQTFYPRKIWASEVKKMAALYGAPIPDDQMKAITDYLVSFHGKEDEKP